MIKKGPGHPKRDPNLVEMEAELHRANKRPGPVTDESEPNKTWRYDFLAFPATAGDYHCVPVLDACSRKITGRYFEPEQTSAAVHNAWGKALANQGFWTFTSERTITVCCGSRNRTC